MKYRKHRPALIAIALMSSLMVGAAGVASAGSISFKKGGTVTVALDNIQWPGLDPALNPDDSADQPIMDAVYGQLFEQGPNGTFVNDLASGYKFTNHNLTLVITIRHGVKFSDGTPFTAQAVAANFQRDLSPANGCVCKATFSPVTTVTSQGDHVLVNLSTPYAPIIASFIGQAPNWVIDPTAFNSMGAASYAQNPVGAGPYAVVANTASSSLTLRPNPSYWEKGHPYLSTLTFLGTATDESTVAALQSGAVQMAIGVTTVSSIDQAKSTDHVQSIPGVGIDDAAFNTQKPPFNNVLARRAVIYATNPKTVLNVASPGFGAVGEAPQGPGGLFYERDVPSYDKYNLAKAQALVKELGGLSFTLESQNTAAYLLIDQALLNEWQQAGMQVTLDPLPTSTYSALQSAGQWQIHVSTVGAFEPYVGQGGLENRFGLTVAASGVRDQTLQGMLNQSIEFYSPTTRLRIMLDIYKYVAKEAYADMLFAQPNVVMFSNSLVGAEATSAQAPSAPQIFWENIAYK